MMGIGKPKKLSVLLTVLMLLVITPYNAAFACDEQPSNCQTQQEGLCTAYTITADAEALDMGEVAIENNCNGTLTFNASESKEYDLFDYGKEIKVFAKAKDGYQFKEWKYQQEKYGLSCSAKDVYGPTGTQDGMPYITVRLAGDIKDKHVTAVFEAIPQKYTLTTAVSPTNAGTVTTGGEYKEGTPITLTASPNANYTFDHWDGLPTGADTTTAGTAKFNMPAVALSVTAVFRDTSNLPKYKLTTAVSPNDAGTVTAGGEYTENTPITLTASPNANYVFDHWDGLPTGADTTTAGTAKFSMPAAALSVTAVFKARAAISIVKTVNGVESTTAYIGNSVTYNITVANTGIVPLYNVLITDAKIGYSKTIAELPATGDGKTYTENIPYAFASGTSLGNFVNTASVIGYTQKQDTEAAATTETVDSQLPASVTSSDSCTVTIQTPYVPPYNPPYTPPSTQTSVTKYSLTVNKTGEGTVEPSVGTYTYDAGTVVNLKATPAEGWKFDGWTGTTGSQVTMDSSKTITAAFTKIPEQPKTNPPDVEVDVPPVEPPVDTESTEIDTKEVLLPRTGGIPAGLFYGAGGMLTAVGLLLRRKQK